MTDAEKGWVRREGRILDRIFVSVISHLSSVIPGLEETYHIASKPDSTDPRTELNVTFNA
jgi:hypothetical protein